MTRSLIVAAFCVMALHSAPGLAASPCPISLQSGTDIGAVDGARGSEWDDAGVLQTNAPGASPCLGALLDGDGTFRPLSVRSKTYLDSDERRWLALFVEVQDQSETQADGSTLANGERFVLQLDPDIGGGTKLSQGAGALQRDWKFDVRHFWESEAGDPDLVVSTLRLFDSSANSGFCAMPPIPHWNEIVSGLTPETTPLAAVRKDLPGGYSVEIAVPFELIGNPGGDLGVAFGVVNDFGDCAGGGVCDGHGASFPTDLPMTNADNPVIGCGLSWIAPDDWATGYRRLAPGDVTISRSPRFWNSEDVDGLACGVVDNAYYPANPCALSVRANIRNSGGSAQTRNLLVVRGDHGAGVVNWRFVDLIEGVSVPGTGETSSDSAQDSDVAGLGGHPCVRAYILPPGLQSDFDLADMQGISTSADLDRLRDVYGLRDAHFAQQNITRRPSGESCPHAGCAIGFWGPAGDGPSFAALFEALNPVPRARAQEAEPDRPDRERTGLFQVAPPRGDGPGQATGGLLEGLGADVGLGAADLDQFGKDHAAVEVVALGYREPAWIEEPLPTPRVNFLEPVGGAIDLIPLETLMAGEAVPITLNIGNPADVPRRIGLSVRLRDPEGAGLAVALSDESVASIVQGPFAPLEVRPITAVVGTPDAIADVGEPAWWPLIEQYWLLLLLLVIIVLLLLVRMTRRSGT